MAGFWRWQNWLYGLFAALIGGGASAVSAAFANVLVDPAHFNLQNGLSHLAQTTGVTFVVAGAISAFAYLKQSPLPQLETSTASISQSTPVDGGTQTTVAMVTKTTQPVDGK